jgi:hypothetical protein
MCSLLQLRPGEKLEKFVFEKFVFVDLSVVTT